MDPELNGSEEELDSLEASEEEANEELDAEELDAEDEDEQDADPDPDVDAEADPDAEIDLPTYAAPAMTPEQREALLDALGDDAIGTIQSLIEQGVRAGIASALHSDLRLAREAGSSPELYRLYGANAQAMLREMKPEVAATKQGVQMATIGALAQRVAKTGDLEGEILRAAKAIEKGRSAGATVPRKAAVLPPEARTPSPSVGKRPAVGSRGNGRASAEKVTNALAQMTGTSPRAARRYFEEEG